MGEALDFSLAFFSRHRCHAQTAHPGVRKLLQAKDSSKLRRVLTSDLPITDGANEAQP